MATTFVGTSCRRCVHSTQVGGSGRGSGRGRGGGEVSTRLSKGPPSVVVITPTNVITPSVIVIIPNNVITPSVVVIRPSIVIPPSVVVDVVVVVAGPISGRAPSVGRAVGETRWDGT